MQSGIREVFEFGGEQFSFDLCTKSELWGSEEVRQWWMPVTELYAQRKQKLAAEQNLLTIADFYWMMCRAEGGAGELGAQERFLLTRLLPQMRSQGSRTIFVDAFLRKKLPKARENQLAELEELLRKSLEEKLTRAQFYVKSHELLGKASYPAGIQSAYRDLLNTLLGRARDALDRGDVANAVAIAKAQWQQFEKSIGRRAGQADRKLVLDVLSYEARAAFHHCYSVVWCALLPRLDEKHQLSSVEFDFHHLWHFADGDERAAERGECLSLFHGHVLGLHPGTSPFLQAPSGRLLMLQWLLQPSEEPFRRLLHGLYVSLVQYKLERDGVAEDRRRRVSLVNRDLVAEEESQATKKTGRRLKSNVST